MRIYIGWYFTFQIKADYGIVTEKCCLNEHSGFPEDSKFCHICGKELFTKNIFAFPERMFEKIMLKFAKSVKEPVQDSMTLLEAHIDKMSNSFILTCVPRNYGTTHPVSFRLICQVPKKVIDEVKENTLSRECMNLINNFTYFLGREHVEMLRDEFGVVILSE